MKVSISMAYERGFAITKLEELSKQVAEHLLKIYLMPDSEYRAGWIKELSAWLDTAYDYGRITKGKRLKEKDFKTSIFARCDERILPSRFLNSIASEYPDLIFDPSVIDKILKFVDKASIKLSSKTEIVWRDWIKVNI